VLPTRNLQVHGVRSAIYEAGALDSEEAAVFVHGNPGPLDDWAVIAPMLAQHCRVVAIDMPGFGRAEHPRDFDFTIAGYARHLAGAVSQLGVRRVHLVLHDFGAAWGARFAVEQPTWVASMTLINPLPLCPDFRWHFFARLWQTPLVGELLQRGVTPSLIRFVMNRDNPRPFPSYFIERVLRDAGPERDRAILRLYRSATDVANTLAPLGASLQRVDPPACLIWGDQDRYAPIAHATCMTKLFTSVELHALPSLGHWPFIDDPLGVRDIVVPFVRRQLGRERSDQRAAL
jgi:pimeloyl-ACP methyl ester carboxylesterase